MRRSDLTPLELAEIGDGRPPDPRGGDPRGFFASFGAFSVRNPWKVLGAWAIVLALAVPLSRRAPSHLFGGSGDIDGSSSLRADSLLKADFANPYAQTLVLALQGRLPSLGGDSLAPMLRDL